MAHQTWIKMASHYILAMHQRSKVSGSGSGVSLDPWRGTYVHVLYWTEQLQARHYSETTPFMLSQAAITTWTLPASSRRTRISRQRERADETLRSEMDTFAPGQHQSWASHGRVGHPNGSTCTAIGDSRGNSCNGSVGAWGVTTVVVNAYIPTVPDFE